MIDGFDEADLWDQIYLSVRKSDMTDDQIKACIALLDEYV